MKRWSFWCCLWLLSIPVLAHAGTAGRVRSVQATRFYVQQLSLQSGVSYTISTSNLSPSSDTVLHVQDINGGFIAGNDDSDGTLASRVTIPASSTARIVWVLVRSFASGTAGTATLTIAPSNAPPTSSSIGFAGSQYRMGRNLIAQSHLFTVEERDGASDTVLLVVSGSPSNAIAFDDDDGVDWMSWIHLDTPCSDCVVVVGSYTPGKTTLIWDEDIHFNNCDEDGMGDALDRAVGADPCNSDTDGDGIIDGAEVIGINTTPAVKLPLYGADPAYKDVFVEVDWLACTSNCGLGPDGTTINYFQLTNDKARVIYDLYAAAGIHVHLDTGLANSDPDNVSGNWGGGRRIASNDCSNLSPERRGYFHFVPIVSFSGNGKADRPGSCLLFTSTEPRIIAHELGHNLNLVHEGSIASGVVNGKIHYRSIMNYAYQNDSTVGFSKGDFANSPLNPIALDESAGLRIPWSSGLISWLEREPFNYLVDHADGAVDWNRDGNPHTPGLVRAAINVGGGEDLGNVMRNELPYATDPAGAWMRDAGGTARFLLVTRASSDGKLQYRTATQSSFSGCESNSSSSCVGFSPANGSAPTTVSNSLGGTLGVSVARYTRAGGGDALLVVYGDTTNRLVHQTVSITSGGTVSFSAPVAIGSGYVADFDPTVVGVGTQVQLFASHAGTLKRWIFDPSTSSWGAPVTQSWADGSAIHPSVGVGVAVGYQQDRTGPQLYGVFPHRDNQELLFTRLDSNWTELAALNTWTLNRPSIVFVPTSPTSTIGRFFIGFNHWVFQHDGFTDGQALMMMTEGNHPSAPGHRLLTFGASLLVNAWQNATSGGVAVMYDPAYDNHVRAAWSFDPVLPEGTPRKFEFAPLADGIYNVVLRDNNDYQRMSENVGCALHGSCNLNY